MSQRKKRRRQNKSHSSGQSRRTSTRKRRRGNPTLPVLVANPHAGLSRSSSRKKRRTRRAHSASPGQRTSARRRRNPHRRATSLARHHKGRLNIRRRRRANPIMGFNLGAVLRVGAFGALGIVSARIFGTLYTSHVSDMVRGDEGKADASNWRNYLDEFLRLVAMELGAFAVDRALLKRVASPASRLAYLIGATAETGRQAIGVVVNTLSPATDRKAWGLDGMYEGSAQIPQGYEKDGRYYILNERGTEYVEVPPEALNGLADRSTFSAAGNGMNGVVASRDAFRRAGSAL